MANGWVEWGKAVGQGILTVIVLALVPGAAVAYLAHIQSVWTLPVLEGLGAALMCACILIIIRAWGHLPSSRVRPNSKNIEACVRSWLDNHRVSITKDPSPETHFRFRINANGKMMTVLRMRDESSDYVSILADLGTHGDNKILDGFTDEDIDQIMFDVRLELARAQCGYSGLVNPPNNFMIFRRLPIQHNLSEFIFMSTLGSLEAAMNLVGLMLQKTKAEVDRRKLAAVPELAKLPQ